MKPRISLVTLGVADLARSRRFYHEGLGLPVFGDFPGVVFLQLQGTWLSLYPRTELAADAQVPDPGAQGFRGFTLAHNVESRERVAAVLAEAERAGARIVKPARDTDWGGHSGYFEDPDGYLWEVAWNPHFDLT